VALLPGTALASWVAIGSGTGAGRAETAPTGDVPTVAVTGRNVAVSWSVSSFGDGTAVDGYVVSRYPSGGGAARTVGASCAGTVTGLTCTEAAVPAGTWRYTITPVHGGWIGGEGSVSVVAAVGAPAFSFASSATITALPATRAGSLSDYVTGETVTFHLDTAGGPILAGSTTPDPIGFAGTATTSVTIPAGTADGVHDVVAVGSDGSEAAASITIDTTAPVATAAVIGKSQGGRPEFVKQGGTYYVYANVTDAVSGVAAVTANVSTVTTGTTAAPLTAGSWTVAGVTYGYRSALLTASNPLAAGSKAFTISATDTVGNAGTTGGFSVTVDNTVPAPTDVQAANGGTTAGKVETGDIVTLTYSETMEPVSILAGWDGTSTTVTVRLIQAGGQDRLQVWNAANTAQLPVGLLRLGRADYTTANVTFTGSTMTLSGGVVTIVLGTPSGATGTAAGTGTITWTPSATATDLASNASTTTNRTETGAADVDF
jgi:hypothetical protein